MRAFPWLGGVLPLLLALPLSARHFDLLILHGTLIDGTGAPRVKADIGVIGDEIAAVGRLESDTANRVIDARGLVVAPGFIDMHSHLDDSSYGPRGLRSPDPRRRAAQNHVTQGITTSFVNADGGQVPSLVDQRAELTRLGFGVNVMLANGHAELRAQAMSGDLKRPANAGEIARMRAILRRGLAEEGSFGLSLGTEYFSGRYSSTEEQIELARELPAYNGVFIPHLRSQGTAPMWYRPSEERAAPPTLTDAIDEVLRVALETGATVVFTHMKAWGPGYRGEASKWIARIQDARIRGARVFMDVYPYDSSGSDGNFVAVPPWAIGGDPADEGNLARRDFRAALSVTLETPGKAADFARDVEHQVALKGGAENVRVLAYPDASYVGKSLAELMKRRGLGLVDLVAALQREGDPFKAGGARMRSFSMAERDIEAFLAQPWCALSTDGWVVLPEEAVGPLKYVGTNRRCFGSFPRRLAYYSLERGVDSLEEAVRKCSGLPAEILSLKDRGRVAAGRKADLVVIDLANLRDNTTPEEPNVYATGMRYVLVNGVPVVDNGERTLALPGRVLQPAGRRVAAAKPEEKR